ncbi:MAG: hypothetical protein Q7J54_03640 [Candidatus Woesearchaeota archaeon]|nr:hypothetical protein [Candidatus Woesearchaeota archaeon]
MDGGTLDNLRMEAELLGSYSALSIAYKKEPSEELLKSFDDLSKKIRELDPHIKLTKPQTDKRFWWIRQQVEIYGARGINKYKRFKLYVASNAGIILIGITGAALLTLAVVGWYMGKKTNEYRSDLKAAKQEATSLKNEVVKSRNEVVTARVALDTANASIASKIAEATAPLEARLEARINELYAMSQDIECEQEFLIEGYNSLAASTKSLNDELASLENTAGEDRQKYAPLIDEVAKFNAKIIELNKTVVDKKYFEEKMKEILDLYLVLKKRSDKDAGGNYTP